MNVCNYCGVELDAEMNFCPLCGHKSNTPIASGKKGAKNSPKMEAHPEDFNFEKLTLQQKRKLVWELAAFVLVLTTVVTFIIDLLITKQVTWSKYTMTIGGVLLIDVSLVLLLKKRVLLMLSGFFLSTSLLLFLLDLYNKNLDNGLTLGIPILFFIFLVVFLLVLLIRKARQKGVNIIAYSLMAAGIICMCIEGIITLHTQNLLKFEWSIIVLISVLPVSAILLFVHFRMKRATNLKKTFHI